MALPAHPSLTRRRLCRLLLLGCLGSGALRASAAQRWLLGKSAHFEMYSDESEAESRRILTSLEEFRANFLRIMPLGGASEPHTTIVVFNRDSDFMPYKPLYQGKPKALAGFFQPGDDEVSIAMTTDIPNPESDPRFIIYHEYVHLMVNTRKAEFPVWLNEGLAEVFSTFKVEKGKVEFGEPREENLGFLQQSSSLWPLTRLIAVTPESPDYNEESRMGMFYAEAWGFTHYLLFGADKATAGKFAKFANWVAQGGDTATVFRQVYGVDLTREDSALRNYLNGGGYYKNRHPAVAQDIPVMFRPATDLERDFALLDLRWRVGRAPDAEVSAYALLKRDPNQPRVHEFLAKLAAMAGDEESAMDHCRKAADLNSTNPWVYEVLLQSALTDYHGATLIDARVPQEQVAPWRAWAARAMDLAPEDHDAIELAATIEAIADKMDVRTINRVQGQVRSMHDPAKTLVALAVVHWRAGQVQSARTLVDLADAEPKADLATRATAEALSSRFPAEPTVAGAPGAAAPAGGSVRSLGMHAEGESEAAAWLDRQLSTRGSTARPLTLAPLQARAAAGSASDRWVKADDLRTRAQAGETEAMVGLATAHACGAGVDYSPDLARDWLQKAADHGYSLAAAGFAAGPLDSGAVVTYLRSRAPEAERGDMPPLDEDLKAQIAKAVAAGDRSVPQEVYRAPARVPAELRQTGGKGQARVHFTIAPDGHPAQVRVTEFSDAATAASAEACVKGWRFVPTIRDGMPIGTVAEVTITFATDKGTSAPARPKA